MPLMIGCAHTQETSLPVDNSCEVFKIVYLTNHDKECLSAYSSNEIADNNDAYVAKCGKKKK